MKALTTLFALSVSTSAVAQECPTCAIADACIATYVKAASDAQKATRVAIRDWKQNLDRKASTEFFNKGTAALQNTMILQIRTELDRLKECLSNIK